jgi:hypothetical protein
MNPLFRLAAVGIVVGAVLGGAASATQSATMPGPSRLPLEFNADGAIRQDANGGLGWDRTGKWQTTRMHYEGGRLVLTIDITPPFTGLPGRSGPAVLFGRLSLLAGHGEIGWLYGTWASESGLESPGAVVDLSLVRTFDRGRWIQVMPLFTDTGGYTRAGTVGKPTPISGPVLSFGAFPASEAQRTRDLNRSLDYAAVVEHARRELGDPSTELPHVDGQLDLRLVGCRGYNVEIRDPDWIHGDVSG